MKEYKEDHLTVSPIETPFEVKVEALSDLEILEEAKKLQDL